MAKFTDFGDVVKNKATQFRKKYGYGETDPIQLNSFLLKNNVLTLYKSLSGNLAGMAIKAGEDNRFIMVNHNHSLGKQHFTIAHELYHLFIQENFTSQRCVTGLFEGQKDIEEWRADFFAANLLLPELGLFELIPPQELQTKKIAIETIFKIQQYFSVSVDAVTFRLVNLGWADRSLFDECKQLAKTRYARILGYDVALYASGNTNKVIGDYGPLAKSLFDSQKISESYYYELVSAVNIDFLTDDGAEDA